MSRRKYAPRMATLKIANGRARWNEQHGEKAIHEDVETAEAQLESMSARYPQYQYCIYQCRWGANYEHGETSEMHWHVGRRRNKK